MKPGWLGLLMVWCCSFATAHAQGAPPRRDPVPADFQLQIPMTVSGDNGVVRVELPLSVYQSARAPKLRDVRVFDATGAAVPFVFVESRASTKTEWREREARLFPVRSEAPDASGELDLDVRAGQDGAVVSVRSRPRAAALSDSNEQKAPRASTTQRALSALVLDLGSLREAETLDSLQFFLPADVTAYRAEIAVEQSDDLKLWSRVAQSRLDWLNDAAASTRLVNDRIELAMRSGRYLRLQWLDGEPLLFARVLARWRTTPTAPRRQIDLTLTPAPGKFPGDWVYEVSPAIEAHEIGLELPLANTVLPVSFGAYRWLARRREWQFVPFAENTFYRITQAGAERTASRMRITPRSLEQWVVRAQDPNAAAPKLVLGFTPRTLIFTAQRTSRGAPEFTLASGADLLELKSWTTSAAPLARVAPGFSQAELEGLERAVLGSPRPTRATAGRTTEVAGDAGSSRRFVLWGVLALGLLVLGVMTWRLAKQIREPGQDDTAKKRE